MTGGDYQIYDTVHTPDAEGRAGQLRHLALISISASESSMRVRNMDEAFISLFEVMASLAHQIEREIEDMKEATK